MSKTGWANAVGSIGQGLLIFGANREKLNYERDRDEHMRELEREQMKRTADFQQSTLANQAAGLKIDQTKANTAADVAKATIAASQAELENAVAKGDMDQQTYLMTSKENGYIPNAEGVMTFNREAWDAGLERKTQVFKAESERYTPRQQNTVGALKEITGARWDEVEGKAPEFLLPGTGEGTDKPAEYMTRTQAQYLKMTQYATMSKSPGGEKMTLEVLNKELDSAISLYRQMMPGDDRDNLYRKIQQLQGTMEGLRGGTPQYGGDTSIDAAEAFAGGSNTMPPGQMGRNKR
jgi:hypothetical protein